MSVNKKPNYKTWVLRPGQPSRTFITPPWVHSAPFVDFDYFRKLEDKYEQDDYYDQNYEEYNYEEYNSVSSYGNTSWQWEPDDYSIEECSQYIEYEEDPGMYLYDSDDYNNYYNEPY